MNRNMAYTLLAVLLFVSAYQPVNAAKEHNEVDTKVNPLQAVVNMLMDMWKTGERNLRQEKIDMLAADGQCTNDMEALKRSNARDFEELEIQTAAKGMAESMMQRATDAIASLNEDITLTTNDITSGQQQRDNEARGAHDEIGSLIAGVKALNDAIAQLEGVKHDVAQEASLVQIATSAISSEKERALAESFVKLAESQPNPDAHAYESQTGHVLEFLNKLLLQFEDERNHAQKIEMQNKFAWGKIRLKYEQRVQEFETAKEGKQNELNSETEKFNEATTAADAANTSLITGKENLGHLTSNCRLQQQQYRGNQETREAELELITKTIGELGKVGVQIPPDWQNPTAPPPVAATMLIQVQRNSEDSESDQLLRQRVVTYLKERTEKLGSQQLSVLLKRLQNDPLQVAKRFLKDYMMSMISVANIDQDQKLYCDREMQMNALTRSKASALIETSLAEVEEEEAKVRHLAEELSRKSEQMKDLWKALREAAAVRKKERNDNKAIIDDAKKSQTACETAIKLLRDFYDAPPVVLLQGQDRSQGQSDDSETLGREMADPTREDVTYSGLDAGSTVINMMEGVLSDYAKLEADTESQEDQLQAAYDRYKTDTDTDIAVINQEYESDAKKKNEYMDAAREKKGELHGAQKQLKAALLVFEDLKPNCVDNKDWTLKIIFRNEEVAACQEALRMLNKEYRI